MRVEERSKWATAGIINAVGNACSNTRYLAVATQALRDQIGFETPFAEDFPVAQQHRYAQAETVHQLGIAGNIDDPDAGLVGE